MVLKLQLLNEDTVYEHLFERYSLLQKHADNLKQDLGIISPSSASLDLTFDPTSGSHAAESFSFELKQSLTSLNSAKDNNNSTTGYVVWSTTPFFLQWLLYSEAGCVFAKGGLVEAEDDPDNESCTIPPLFSFKDYSEESPTAPPNMVLELGSGVAGILCVALGNYVDKFVCTDQKALLSGLKRNIEANIDELSLRSMTSTTLGFEKHRKTIYKTQLEVLDLDWEKFDTDPQKLPQLLRPEQPTTVYILSMDVVYNEFLINPYLKTLRGLLEAYAFLGHIPKAILGIQLRDQDVIQS